MLNLEYAFVVFADIRGFTTWSATAAVAPHLQRFMSEFYSIFKRAPGGGANTFLKPNGDGILLVRSFGNEHATLDQALVDFLNETWPFVHSEFNALIVEHQRIMRCAIPLKLGFGINAGMVHRLQFDLPDGAGSLTDFASGTLNTAARLCDLARPEGLVISQEAFPDWSPRRAGEFELVEVPVKSIGTIPVWMSRPILTEGLPREARRVVVEFHVGIVCFEPHTRMVLLAHRRDDRELYRGLWETGGGQLYPGEGVVQAAIRIARAEFGVRVEVAWDASVVPFEIETERRYIPGMKVLCLFGSTEFSGFRNERQHLETRAIPLDDLRDSERWPDSALIPGTKSVVNTLIGRYLAGGR